MLDAARNRTLSDYLLATDFYGQLYALGATLHESGEIRKREIGLDLFRVVAEFDLSGRWSGRARRQLAEPFLDDFMIVF
jgi:hypothetical protein